jgi:hypothetical protein
MKYAAFFLTILLIVTFSCKKDKTGVTFENIENMEWTIQSQNNMIGFNMLLKNRDKKNYTVSAMGIEVFAGGLKVGDNYCKINSNLARGEINSFPISINFRNEDLGNETFNTNNPIEINVYGQVVLKRDGKEFNIPINHKAYMKISK